ncbi:MAG: hypothetical protein AAGG01_06255, partial [Planctomycetota bacterium]
MDPKDPGRSNSGDDVFQGTLETVTYHDEKSLYGVLRLAPDAGFKAPDGGSLFSPGRVTAVGKIADPIEGVRLKLSGKWGHHPSHGVQFEFSAAEALPPATEAGLVRYLASKVFEGVGPTLAQRIVDKLGAEALERISEDAGCLDGIKGIRPDLAERLRETV